MDNERALRLNEAYEKTYGQNVMDRETRQREAMHFKRYVCRSCENLIFQARPSRSKSTIQIRNFQKRF